MSQKESSAYRNIEKCSECGGMLLSRYGNDKAVCITCGLVVNSNANRPVERQQSSPPHDDKSLSKITRHRNSGELAKNTTLNGRVQNGLLEMWWRSARVSDETEKKMALAFAEITRTANFLSLPRNVIEKASLNYKMIAERRRVKGRNIRTLSAAALYLACKQCGFAVTLNHVAWASGISKKKVGCGYRFILKELDCFVSPAKPSQLLSNLLDSLASSEETRLLTGRILKVVVELKLTNGKNPSGMLAAAFYLASLVRGERKTQREVAEITRVTETTIRNRYKEIQENLLFVTYM